MIVCACISAVCDNHLQAYDTLVTAFSEDMCVVDLFADAYLLDPGGSVGLPLPSA